jgi:hypothetical protein
MKFRVYLYLHVCYGAERESPMSHKNIIRLDFRRPTVREQLAPYQAYGLVLLVSASVL